MVWSLSSRAGRPLGRPRRDGLGARSPEKVARTLKPALGDVKHGGFEHLGPEGAGPEASHSRIRFPVWSTSHSQSSKRNSRRWARSAMRPMTV